MICIPAILTSVSMTHDKGLRLGFATNEMSAQEKQAAMEQHDAFGYLIFKPNKIDAADIPTEDCEDKNKTPAKRLRAVLYKLHIQCGGKNENFEQFYREKMEKLITQIKARLDN
jgi:hypothetical protein